MSRGDAVRGFHRKAEQLMARKALDTWTQSEWRSEDFRDPSYERWLVEQAERSAQKREAKGVR